MRWKLKNARQCWWDGSLRMHGNVGKTDENARQCWWDGWESTAISVRWKRECCECKECCSAVSTDRLNCWVFSPSIVKVRTACIWDIVRFCRRSSYGWQVLVRSTHTQALEVSSAYFVVVGGTPTHTGTWSEQCIFCCCWWGTHSSTKHLQPRRKEHSKVLI